MNMRSINDIFEIMRIREGKNIIIYDRFNNKFVCTITNCLGGTFNLKYADMFIAISNLPYPNLYSPPHPFFRIVELEHEDCFCIHMHIDKKTNIYHTYLSVKDKPDIECYIDRNTLSIRSYRYS